MKKRGASKLVWSPYIDSQLVRLVEQFGPSSWKEISNSLNRCIKSKRKTTNRQCRQRWYNHLSPSLAKKTWTVEEQTRLLDLHKIKGNKWKQIWKQFPGRCENSIKNHFYSTMRKFLRKIEKSCAQDRYVDEIKKVKPKVLSQIFQFKSFSFLEPSSIFSFDSQIETTFFDGTKLYQLIKETLFTQNLNLTHGNKKYMHEILQYIIMRKQIWIYYSQSYERERQSELEQKNTENLLKNFDKYADQVYKQPPDDQGQKKKKIVVIESLQKGRKKISQMKNIFLFSQQIDECKCIPMFQKYESQQQQNKKDWVQVQQQQSQSWFNQPNLNSLHYHAQKDSQVQQS